MAQPGETRTNARGERIQLQPDGTWLPLPSVGDSPQVSVVGGQASLPPELARQQLEDIGDFFGGAGIGFNNILEALGAREETPERTAAESVFGQRSPIAAALGEGSAAAVAAIPGAVGGEALAGMLGLRALGTFLFSSLGSGTTAQLALDEVGGADGFFENIVNDLSTDAVTSAALGIAGRVPSMAVRVTNAIRKGGTFKREIEPGDAPGSSADLIQRIQDAELPLTTGQASGSEADLLLEGSLRRSPFTGGFEKIDRAQQVGVNSAAARAIGLPEGTEFLDATVRAGAKKDIGDNINAVVEGLPDMQVNQGQIDQLTALAETPFIKGTTGTSGLAKLAGDLQNKLDAGELLTPTEWKRMRELINAELGDASGANVGVLGQALDLVDDMPQVPANQLEQYGEFREQWRTLLQLDKGATVTADGNVNVGQLNRNLQNSFGNVVGEPSRTPATQQLRELTEAFSTRRMQRGPSSGTAENLQAAAAIENAGRIAGDIASGNLAGGAATGGTMAALNALSSPLHLGPATAPELEQLLRAFGITGAAAAQQDITGNN